MKPDKAENQILQTIDAFAESVGVTVATVRIWIRKNKIPTVKVGKRRLVNIHKLKDWLESEG